jgi:hypothetical protein
MLRLRRFFYEREQLAVSWPIPGWSLIADDIALCSGFAEQPWWMTRLFMCPERRAEIDSFLPIFHKRLDQVTYDRVIDVEGFEQSLARMQRAVDELVSLTSPGRPDGLEFGYR